MAYTHGMVVADAGRSVSEIEAIRELGINRLMITDEKLDLMLEGMSFRTEMVPDPVSGKKVPRRFTVPKWAAVFIARSQLIRTSYIDKIDAHIGMIKTRRLLRKAKMKMTEEEYEEGGALLLEAVELITDTAWCDAVEGKKPKLLKVSPRTYEIQWKQGKKGEAKGYM